EVQLALRAGAGADQVVVPAHVAVDEAARVQPFAHEARDAGVEGRFAPQETEVLGVRGPAGLGRREARDAGELPRGGQVARGRREAARGEGAGAHGVRRGEGARRGARGVRGEAHVAQV